ncbi:MAG: hypothetical protein WA883_08140 [Phormidesmis sp.]
MRPLSPHEHQLQSRPPRLVSHTHYCVMGDVTVADGATVAPGVVLQASPGSRIAIAAGTCLAGGVCIQSRQGVLTIESGANLGANVLVVGHGTIGANACISPGSTLMNPQIEANTLLPPNSLVSGASAKGASAQPQAQSSYSSYSSNTGRHSPAVNHSPQARQNVTAYQEGDSFVNTFVEPPPTGPKAVEIPSLSGQNGQFVDPSVQSNDVQLSNGYNNGYSNGYSSSGNASSANRSALSVPANHRVYGKDQVNQLISTLFPNRPA